MFLFFFFALKPLQSSPMLMKYITTRIIGMPGNNDREYGVMFLR